MPFWLRQPKPMEPAPQPAARRPGEDDRAFFERVARSHLDDEMAERWLSLLRPAVRLTTARGQPVVARLGGRPRVPDDFEWPVWQDKGPLSFVAEVDLAVLAGLRVDTGLALPSEGRLLAFYFDGSVDGGVDIVGTWDPESLAGARLVHLTTSRDHDSPRRPPEPLADYPEIELGGVPEVTHPGWDHPAVRQAFGAESMDDEDWLRHPVSSAAFADSFIAVNGVAPVHRIGGWAHPVQGPVELEVASDDAEALAWHLLLQVDTDGRAGMIWGDTGALYWLGLDGGLAATSFTWQCY